MTSLQHFEEQKFLGPLASAVRRRLKEFDTDDIVSRIWSHDHTVWKPDPTEITNRLGWLTLPADMRRRIPELKAFARQVAATVHACDPARDGWVEPGAGDVRPHVRHAPGALELTVLDTTHPATIARVEASLDLDTPCSSSRASPGPRSKRCPTSSTSTPGPAAGVELHRHHGSRYAPRGAGKLQGIPPGVPEPARPGGRYSALSLFGLVPAAVIGADLEDLLFSAQEMADGCKAVPAFENPGAWLGASWARRGWPARTS